MNPDDRQFLHWLLDRSGVEPGCYRERPLARRLAACLRRLRVRSTAEAWKRLRREPERMPEALSTLLIGVTQFFRDPEVFAHLDAEVLPRLFADRGALRVWSVGCADGAELYSMAMLLARRGMLESSVLLGTDCREDAIRQARRGWFENTRLEALDPGLRSSYVVLERGGGRICSPLRQATSWQQSDALSHYPAHELPWDLILCRNMAIYLEPAAAASLWTVLTRSLRTGGVLVVGKAERPQPGAMVRLRPCVLGKQG